MQKLLTQETVSDDCSVDNYCRCFFFLDNIIPLYLFNQCLFGDFPINKTLLVTVLSFIDKVHYDVFQRVIAAIVG